MALRRIIVGGVLAVFAIIASAISLESQVIDASVERLVVAQAQPIEKGRARRVCRANPALNAGPECERATIEAERQTQPEQQGQPETQQRPRETQQRPSETQQRPRPDPSAANVAPTNPAERIVQRTVGSDRYQQEMQRLSEIRARQQRLLEEIQIGTGAGIGAPSADRYFDQASPRTGTGGSERPAGTRFFGGGAAPPPVVNPVYRPTTQENAQSILRTYPSIGGGIVLEGSATQLGPINRVEYHAVLNALLLDDRAAYFMPISARSTVELCRAIHKDVRVGVSLGEVHIAYGAVPKDSDIATDLKLADHFLGDIVFGGKDWTAGYRFANGFEPQPHRGQSFHGLVHFNFSGFQFRIVEEEVRPTEFNFNVQLIPVSSVAADDGGHLPDLDAIAQGRKSAQFELNAKHLAENVSYYRKEKIVERAFEYGEAAALIRGLKAAGVDLEALAKKIELAINAPSSSPPKLAHSDLNKRLESDWVDYLKQIQGRNYYPNWSGPPHDLYVKRKTQGQARENRMYRVIGVAANDVLNVRSGPSADYSIIATIPPQGRGVQLVGACQEDWCGIDYNGVKGWVNRQFLTLDKRDDIAVYRVANVATNDVLNVRSGPGARHPIVGFIPPNGRGIRIASAIEHACVGDWCTVEYSNFRGWVNTHFLSPEQTQSAATFKVFGVAANDVLNVRSGPASNHTIVATIPPHGRGVRLVGNCKGEWCVADYNGKQGWVNRRFLAPE